jgi:hypothetical protein
MRVAFNVAGAFAFSACASIHSVESTTDTPLVPLIDHKIEEASLEYEVVSSTVTGYQLGVVVEQSETCAAVTTPRVHRRRHVDRVHRAEECHQSSQARLQARCDRQAARAPDRGRCATGRSRTGACEGRLSRGSRTCTELTREHRAIVAHAAIVLQDLLDRQGMRQLVHRTLEDLPQRSRLCVRRVTPVADRSIDPSIERSLARRPCRMKPAPGVWHRA